jgi:hypothetical protein
MQRPVPPGCGLDASLTTLLCKRITVVKSKEVKTGYNLAEASKEDCDSNKAALPMMMMMIELFLVQTDVLKVIGATQPS